MTFILRENPGDRPSHLTLGRFHTGELSGGPAEQVRDWLEEHPECTFLDELEEARHRVRPLDATALRTRAASSVEQPPPARRAANTSRWLLPLLAIAATLLGLLSLPATQPLSPPEVVQFRGGATLEAFQLRGEVLVPYEGAALGEGDVVGFRVVPGRHSTVVLLSVEVDGSITVFYPDAGVDALPVASGGHPVALPGSVTLDGAPDPELFVAVFDASVDRALAEIKTAWDSDGLEGVRAWAESSPSADAVTVVRR